MFVRLHRLRHSWYPRIRRRERGEGRDLCCYCYGRHVCTPTEAVLEQDLAKGRVRSTRCVRTDMGRTGYGFPRTEGQRALREGCLATLPASGHILVDGFALPALPRPLLMLRRPEFFYTNKLLFMPHGGQNQSIPHEAMSEQKLERGHVVITFLTCLLIPARHISGTSRDII